MIVDEKVDKKEENKKMVIDDKNNNKLENKEDKIETLDKKEEKEIPNNDIDIHAEKSENFYHRTDKMQSLGALNEDKTAMDEIITYKKSRNLDYDFFESKKDVIDVKSTEITNMIEFGALDLDEYKATITVQLKWDQELIKFAEKDSKITQPERDVILTRINKRIEIINSELAQEMPDEEEELDEENNENKETTSNENKETTSNENKETSNEIKTDPEPIIQKPHEIKNKKLYSEIQTKLTDYKDAAEYFHKIGSAEQEEDAYSRAKEISQAVKLFEEGKENEVDEFSLPIGITPDYICGYTKQERLNKFSEIIKEFSRRKNELNEALVQRTEKLRQIDKREFAKIKDMVKKDLDERKGKIEFYNKLIHKLAEFAKNPWVPAPLYSHVEEEEKIEKINEEVPQYAVDLHIGKSTYDKTKAFLEVKLRKF